MEGTGPRRIKDTAYRSERSLGFLIGKPAPTCMNA
jgi:hypothetical protein